MQSNSSHGVTLNCLGSGREQILIRGDVNTSLTSVCSCCRTADLLAASNPHMGDNRLPYCGHGIKCFSKNLLRFFFFLLGFFLYLIATLVRTSIVKEDYGIFICSYLHYLSMCIHRMTETGRAAVRPSTVQRSTD